jgi:hypothetical protein
MLGTGLSRSGLATHSPTAKSIPTRRTSIPIARPMTTRHSVFCLSAMADYASFSRAPSPLQSPALKGLSNSLCVHNRNLENHHCAALQHNHRLVATQRTSLQVHLVLQPTGAPALDLSSLSTVACNREGVRAQGALPSPNRQSCQHVGSSRVRIRPNVVSGIAVIDAP